MLRFAYDIVLLAKYEEELASTFSDMDTLLRTLGNTRVMKSNKIVVSCKTDIRLKEDTSEEVTMKRKVILADGASRYKGQNSIG